jgi:L-iditol 2-dehydrogenase
MSWWHCARRSAAPATWCGHCFYCRHDAKALCLEPIDFGSTHPGALAEYVLIPALMVEQGGLVVVADDVSMEKASLLEPLGTCLRGLVTQGRLQPGQTVLVVGDGPIGLIQVMLAVHLGAGTVICAGHHSERLALALRFGARLVVNTLSKELRPIVLGETEGRGADLVLSAVPSHEALQECLDLVRGAGRLVIFGGVARGSTIQVDPNTVHYGETVITGSYNCTIEEFRQATELARHLPLQEIVDHRVPLLKIREGFDLMQERHSLKVLVTM